MTKYDSHRDAALHFLCLDGWANESFGNVDTYGVFIYRISNDSADVSLGNTEMNSLLEECADIAGNDGSALRSEMVGHFMVSENSDGFVNVREYATASELCRVFDDMEQHYVEFEAS